MMNTILALLFLVFSTTLYAQSGAKVGDQAPSFSIDEWLKGEPVTSFDKEKVYLIEFWGNVVRSLY
jgi:hypothetical protein